LAAVGNPAPALVLRSPAGYEKRNESPIDSQWVKECHVLPGDQFLLVNHSLRFELWNLALAEPQSLGIHSRPGMEVESVCLCGDGVRFLVCWKSRPPTTWFLNSRGEQQKVTKFLAGIRVEFFVDLFDRRAPREPVWSTSWKGMDRSSHLFPLTSELAGIRTGDDEFQWNIDYLVRVDVALAV